MKVSIDPTKCEGHAVCAGLVASIFEVGDDDLAVVDNAALDAADDAVRVRVRSAASACPTMAIEVAE
ncbi:ferredoxin [Nocardia callitridis]|uniref:Ferredoxin n=1 Tax=Nocardia callitridis TaxID=648753 RepID=A0ABP9KJY3_9NOCA